MTIQPAGSTVTYRVTWLEMAARPAYDWPRLPAGHEAALLKAENPPVWYFLALYDAVGRDYAWEDMHEVPEAELGEWLVGPDVELFTLMRSGWPHGFFVLDWRTVGACDLSYFGLVPEAVGRGFGTYLLRTAVLTGWERPGVAKMRVNTCSLDHPRALAAYQKAGFEVVAQEQRSRVLKRARDPSRIPQ